MINEIREQDKNIISISGIFNDNYIIPIYQRNYSWGKKEIEQFLNDIYGNENIKEYYLGSLVVSKKNYEYEVIDGQQRLTTIFLLKIYLENKKLKYFGDKELQFEARPKYIETFNSLKEGKEYYDDKINNCKELFNGYKCIKSWFDENKTNNIVDFEKIKIFRIILPDNTDFNRYFEIMNSRSEQLELHEILKGRLLQNLTDEEEKKIANEIWKACSNMDGYVQKHLKTKKKLNDYSKLNEEYIWKSNFWNLSNESSETDNEKTLINILQSNVGNQKNDNSKNNNDEELEETSKVTSIITFQNFLLHILNIMEKTNNLDDKKLLERFDNYKKIEKEKKIIEKDISKRFLFNLLKYRFLFDKFIIKRNNEEEEEKWSLQEIIVTFDKKNKTEEKFEFKNTFKDKYDNEKVIMIESCLAITYTSPNTTHWITEVLKNVEKNLEDNNLIECLEIFACKKIIDSNFFKVEKKEIQDCKTINMTYDGRIKHIVFTYLDYILWREDKEIEEDIRSKWNFKYRNNSIEHFYPQHSSSEYRIEEFEETYFVLSFEENNLTNIGEIKEEMNSKISDNEENAKNRPDNNASWKPVPVKHMFGNLALISSELNSKLSNDTPLWKIIRDEKISEQSLKLKKMAKKVEENNGNWSLQDAKDHEKEMIKYLKGDIEKYKDKIKQFNQEEKEINSSNTIE